MQYREKCISIQYEKEEKFYIDLSILEPISLNDEKKVIILLLGGFLGIDESDKINPNSEEKRIIVGSKGYKKNPLRGRTKWENIFINDLISKGWKLVLLKDMQFCKPDNKLSEMWIDQYIQSIAEEFKEHKLFLVGFSSGSYIVGLCLQHHLLFTNNSKILGYGILSFPIEIGNSDKKTNFSHKHFDKPTLFLSGDETLDKKEKPPFVDGFKNTADLYSLVKENNSLNFQYKSLNEVGHAIFEKINDNNKSVAAQIVDTYFTEISIRKESKID